MSSKEDVQVDVIEHPNEDVTINVVSKPKVQAVPTKENDNVADTVLNVDPTKVPVRHEKVYVDAGYASEDLQGATLERIGDKKLLLTLECGDEITLDTEKLMAVVYKAADLPINS